MDALIELLKVCAILIASAMLGNWFLLEVKSSKRKGLPWYTPYFSVPGIIVICCIIIAPILIWLLAT
ncbi:MAG: hypothetical protein MUE70_09025 [Desulfobacterales bacterium]|nr:hypothetical protein [Desulfobacterales bacterium]